jgi:hypothetical protein
MLRLRQALPLTDRKILTDHLVKLWFAGRSICFDGSRQVQFRLLTFWRPLIPQEVDLHTKRTGHSEFADKTMEAAKPIDLEAPPKPASEAMDVDAPATGEQQGEDGL